MENPLKRKRTPMIKIELDDSDCNIVSSGEDEEYMPATKKKKAPAKPKEKAPAKPKEKAPKQIKVKKEAKPKVVKRKAPSSKRGQKKVLNSDNVLSENSEDLSSLDRANLNLDSANIFTAPTIPSQSLNDAELEKIVSTAVAAAKKSCQSWRDEDVVAVTSQVPTEVAKNVIDLFNQDCTIPFIVRYRKQMTGSLQAEKLREIQEAYEEVKQVHKKVDTILKTIKNEKFDESTATSFLCAQSLDEVELLYAPFKPGSKKTLAERSKQLGLEPVALQLLEGKECLDSINLQSFVKPQKGLESVKDILSGIQNIIADKVSKDRRVLDFIREKIHHPQIRMLSSKSASAEKEDKQAFVLGKTTQNFKYENYYDFNVLVKNLAHHQVMALNRGEKQKVLKVKVQVPEYVKDETILFICNLFFSNKILPHETNVYLKSCMEDSYDRLIEPYMSRQIRSELSKNAEKESINVFGSNVRSLLLTPPVRGKTVIGIDPGFSHGCKIATVSLNGEVLGTDVIYPHCKGKTNKRECDGVKLKSMISSFGAEVIAIGNGTACRETEVWLSDLNNCKYFYPYTVKYCIVNENGASIYSVTKEAEAELPGMDPNLRSAVSIARRLQDPLLEYVKIEPKHLGVGMYQHDVSETQLKKALDSIVEECVSFVGVDLNVCPEVLLRKISGLSASRAKQIVEWRTKNGAFINRQQLLEVKGLGQKTFEQCAGFVRILPETCTSVGSAVPAKKKTMKATTLQPFDRTIIHPESYYIAEKFLRDLSATPEEIGQQTLVDKVNNRTKFFSTEAIAEKLSTSSQVMQLIIDALSQLHDYDIRGEFDQPLFRTSVRSFSDLKVNQELTGRVNNVTGFGAFMDVGVGTNGLIHVSKMKGRKLSVGDRLKVRVIEVNLQKKRLGLELIV